MKKISVLFLMFVLPFLVACSGGGGGLDDALNPYGFVVTAFDTTSAATLPSNDVRSVIRPTSAGSMYVGTNLGVASFDPAAATPVFTALAGAPANVNKMVADGTQGDFYVCADNGLYKFDGVAKTFSAVDAQFTGKKVLSFARQTSSVFWVGLEDLTAAQTIAKVDNGVISFYGSANGITASAVADIYADTNMVMACGTGDTGKGGLFRFNPSADNFVVQVVTAGLEKGASLFFMLGTNWYAGGPDSGLLVSTDNGLNWAKTNLQNCTPVDFSVETYNMLGYQRYWIATEKAAYLSYDMINFGAYSTANALAGDSAKQIYSGSLIWVANDGATGGLSRLAFDGN